MGDQSGASRQTPDGSAVVARALTVTRGRGRGAATLLRDVTLEVPRGSFTAIIGPNGAGKTTLAQAIAGVVPPPRGQVLIARDGAPPLDAGSAKPRELAAQIGFVFQNPEHQFVAHTVRDELAHGLRRLSPADRDARVDEMLGRFDLRAHADRHPFRLSGGQKRRLSVGTALIGGADRPGGVLVLDEPTFGQDRARADALLALLDELHRGGTTVIVVTHDPDLVARHATHIAAVRDGRLAGFGPADEVLPLVREPAFWRPDAGTNTQVPSGHPGPDTTIDSDQSASAATSTAAGADPTVPAPVAPPGPDTTLEADRPISAAPSASATADTGHDPPDVHPRAAPSRSPLERLDPLALLAAVLPAMIGLVFTRDVATPAIAVAAAYAVVLIGAPKTRALAVWLCVILPVMALAIAGGFTLWSDAATGAATGLRLTALLALALIPGLSTDGTAFVRSVVAHLRVPYRIGYAALAAYRFVPRFRHELEVIRSAHRVRGTGGDPVSRAFTAIVPLLASAIRHAERVALAMDARAFGAFPTRTERHPPRWRVRDTVAVVVGLVVTAAVFASGAVLPG
nr:ATP-binding cassette domain-containing protein [Microbacterium sp. JB110]